jgi:glycogen synthase
VETLEEGKRQNKSVLQKHFNMTPDPDAPVFFWPSRLDPVQKGPELLAHILFELTLRYPRLQVVMIANGPYQHHFKDIVNLHNLHLRVAVCDFDEKLSRQGYAGSDFLFMPSRFEPCGLPQMVGPKYGTLPIACDTGGLHDTVEHIDRKKGTGNGFLFKDYSVEGLWWAMEEAMNFYDQPQSWRIEQTKRIMGEAENRFNHKRTAQDYMSIYRKVLGLS